MTQEQKEMTNKHESNFIVVKTIEELNELSSALAQYLTKPVTKSLAEHAEDIVKEVADVEIMLTILKHRFNLDIDVSKRIPEKLAKFESYYKDLGNNIGKLRKEDQYEQ